MPPEPRAYLALLLAPAKDSILPDEELEWQSLRALYSSPPSDFASDVSTHFLYNTAVFVHHLLAAAPGAPYLIAAKYLEAVHDAFLVAITPPNHARHQGVLSLFRELKIQLYLARIRADEPCNLDSLFRKRLADEHVIEATLDDERDWSQRTGDDLFKLETSSVKEIAALHSYSSFLQDILQYIRGLVKEYDAQLSRKSINDISPTSVDSIPSPTIDTPVEPTASSMQTSDPSVNALAKLLANVVDDNMDVLASMESLFGSTLPAMSDLCNSSSTSVSSSNSSLLNAFASEDDVRRAIAAVVNSTDTSIYNFGFSSLTNQELSPTDTSLSKTSCSDKPSASVLEKRRRLIGKAKINKPASISVQDKSDIIQTNPDSFISPVTATAPSSSTTTFDFNDFEGLTDAIDPILRSFSSSSIEPESSTSASSSGQIPTTDSHSIPKSTPSVTETVNLTVSDDKSSDQPQKTHSSSSGTDGDGMPSAKRPKKYFKDRTPPPPSPSSDDEFRRRIDQHRKEEAEARIDEMDINTNDRNRASVSNMYRQNRAGAGQRIPWTVEEDRTFREELERIYATGPPEQRVRPWAAIMKRHGPSGEISNILMHRNNVGLKDRARNLRAAYDKRGQVPPPGLAHCNAGSVRNRRRGMSSRSRGKSAMNNVSPAPADLNVSQIEKSTTA